MSSQKRVSQVSFAAVALLAAALPCLAQTENSRNRNLTNHGTEIATLRNERLAVHKAESKTSSDKTIARTTNASRDKFNETIAQAMSAASGFQSNASFSESDWQKAQTVSNQFESTASKTITFVPSRGQKLPD